MRRELRFPIRTKILITLLFIVTVVVSVITFSMAKLFHEDKQAYINDLISTVALSTAEETHSLLVSYRERLLAYERIMTNEKIEDSAKATLLEEFFQDFPDLLAVTLHQDGQDLASAYAVRDLETAGLSPDDLRKHRSIRPITEDDLADSGVFVENSTITPDLPMLTLAVASGTDEQKGPSWVLAVVRMDGMLRLAARSNVFEVFIADPNGVLLAHPDVQRVARKERTDILDDAGQYHQVYGAGMTWEFVRDGTDMVAGLAVVDFGGLSAGALIPRSAAYLASRDLLKSLVVVALVLLMLATLISILWAQGLTRPMEKLSGATREIAKGQFDTQVQVRSRDEIGTLASSFNQMASELRHRDEALKEAQSQLVQSEKMAAFGQLGAGFAHEVKNPLAGILGCAQLSMRKLDKGTPLRTNLELIEKETRRCKDIIENLLKFARQEKTVHSVVEVNKVAEDAMAIVNHQLELKQVHLEKDLADDLPLVRGNANQLQQVLMNLIMNAQQAMEGNPGSVKVTTRRIDSQVEVRVSDTGPGIPKEIQAKIFEPFFTTKPGGKGTGLGLSVSFGIVRDHKGEIRIESEPGKGATFIIMLPVAEQPEAKVRSEVEAMELTTA
jgi:signal transduction histidine kinase